VLGGIAISWRDGVVARHEAPEFILKATMYLKINYIWIVEFPSHLIQPPGVGFPAVEEKCIMNPLASLGLERTLPFVGSRFVPEHRRVAGKLLGRPIAKEAKGI
jgi:hypothetical protein